MRHDVKRVSPTDAAIVSSTEYICTHELPVEQNVWLAEKTVLDSSRSVTARAGGRILSRAPGELFG